ncbi:hypothetical protein [Bradyrhizobium sp. JR3.5]
MPTERLAMRHVRYLIRMKAARLPTRKFARRVGAAPPTVRLRSAGSRPRGPNWPPPDDVTDAVLEARLFARSGTGSQH